MADPLQLDAYQQEVDEFYEASGNKNSRSFSIFFNLSGSARNMYDLYKEESEKASIINGDIVNR